MKKIRNFLLLCLVAIVMTGCVKFNAAMTIRQDKSMDFSIVYAFDKSIMGEMGSLKEEDFEELKQEGYTIEKYKEGNFEGFKVIRKINNIDEVSTDKDVEFDLSGMMENDENNKYMFKVVKDGDKSTYYAKFKFDTNDSGLNDDDDDLDLDLDITASSEDETGDIALPDEDNSLDNLDLSGLMENLDLSFNVYLPNSAISSNATTKENNNKNLSWKLNSNGVQTIEFAFEIDANAGGNNMLLYIGIGAGVLLVAIVAIVLMSKKKKPVVAPVIGNPEPTVATPTVENTAPTVEPTQTEEPKE